jgi:RNA polymerase sigma factor (sigma-70 family)
MSGDDRSKALFVESIPQLERIVAAFGRRYRLSADAAADLDASIKLRIVEDNYAVFRKFRGECALSTYLTVVVAMLAREHHVRQHGRWRPSAAAQRQGKVAVQLETLVQRKGLTLSEAGETLRTRGDTTLSDRQLAKLLSDLPRRDPMRPTEVGEAALDSSPAQDDAERNVLSSEAKERRRSVEVVLVGALSALTLEDRMILKLRFWQGLSVAEVARALAIDQKPLYRRLERMMADLRELLSTRGVTVAQVEELIGDPSA